MDRFPSNAVPSIEVREVLQDEREDVSVRVDGQAVDRGAEVGSAGLFDHEGLLEVQF